MALPLGEPSLAGDPNVVESSMAMVMNRGWGRRRGFSSEFGASSKKLSRRATSAKTARNYQSRGTKIKLAMPGAKSNWRSQSIRGWAVVDGVATGQIILARQDQGALHPSPWTQFGQRDRSDWVM